MKRFIAIIGGVVLASFLCGCSAYVDNYYYGPRPARADVPATQPSQPPPVSALVSVIGVHRADSQLGIPDSVEVRMRLENTDGQVVYFSPESLQMSDGAFVQFPAPILRPPQAWAIQPGQMAILTAYFPFPRDKSWGNTDLQSLEVRWTEQIGDRPVRQIVLFNRAFTDYYYESPYWGGYPYPYYPVGGGAVIVHLHR